MEPKAGDRPRKAELAAQLVRVARRRILFGHQSVGGNLLEGIARLAACAGVDFPVADADPAGLDLPAGFSHALLAENGDPFAKLRHFERVLCAQPRLPEIAMLKFCYADFAAQTDVDRVFAGYRAMVERLRRGAGPGLVFVHVTTPLTRVEGGLRAFAKRLLGRAPYGIEQNMRRGEYNDRLRRTYGGREPVFDLARVESTAADGSPVLAAWRGRAVAVLALRLTDDGGHLNEAGKLLAARELLSTLAAVPLPRDGRRAPFC